MAKKLSVVSLQELYKRCPQNQVKQFEWFRDKTAKYNERVYKHPENLPKIDWNYYRSNVRGDFVKMVDEFEEKYKELNSVYGKRVEMDLSHYYEEIENVRCEVQNEYDEFICESEERIRAYEKEIARIRALKPFEEMTCEEFCILCPEKATNFPCRGNPSFWPHDADEQKPGPVGMPEGHKEEDGADGGGTDGGRKLDGKKAAEVPANTAIEVSTKPEAQASASKPSEKKH